MEASTPAASVDWGSMAKVAHAEEPRTRARTGRTNLSVGIAVALATLILLADGVAWLWQHERPFRLPSGGWGWMKTSGFTASMGGGRTRTWVDGTDWFVRVDIDEDGDGVVDLIAEDWEGPAPERCYRRHSSGWAPVNPSECQRATEPDGI
jgi:hypothetical protein